MHKTRDWERGVQTCSFPLDRRILENSITLHEKRLWVFIFCSFPVSLSSLCRYTCTEFVHQHGSALVFLPVPISGSNQILTSRLGNSFLTCSISLLYTKSKPPCLTLPPALDRMLLGSDEGRAGSRDSLENDRVVEQKLWLL